MPVRQVFAFGDEPISAGHRQPFQRPNGGRGQFHAVRDPPFAPFVIATAARLGVEQRAADVGEMDVASVFVLEFDEAAAGAAVAQTLPLVEKSSPRGTDFQLGS